jgi:hypothetical protein
MHVLFAEDKNHALHWFSMRKPNSKSGYCKIMQVQLVSRQEYSCLPQVYISLKYLHPLANKKNIRILLTPPQISSWPLNGN